jgi:DNA polymerase-3 subunit epsilon
MAFHCKYVVAHNGNSFDKPMLEAALKSRDLINSEIMAKPWIDTMTDLPFKYDSRKLNYMASDMGFLNPFPHRAIFDVMAMLKVLSRFDFNEIVERALTPKLKIICKTTVPWEDGGKSNEIAKSLGFRWDANAKLWTQLMLASDYEKIKDPEGVRIGVL